jgi:sec-independent protein translocase protein TatB
MLSIPHMIVIFVIVLVVFGPQKLPELARGLGKLMAEFRKASTDFKSAFENEMRDLERQAAEVERKKRELLASNPTAQPQPATLATPSGAETQPGTTALASGSASGLASGQGDEGATEAPVITPVAESVARSPESPDSTHSETNPAGADTSEPPPAPNRVETASENGNKPAVDITPDVTPHDLDAPHDYKQPA